MKYQEYKKLDLPQIDKEILKFWEEHQVFKKSIEERPADDLYVFYEGPPSANGKPGIHHVMSRTIKDLFCRFQTMQGKRVERKGGWDTHGLPIELSVEKELGITKEDIGKTISIEEYNDKCRSTVMRYKDMWDDITMKMGYWVDLDHPYITFENNYIETVWYLLKRLYDKGLLYKGYSVQPYSPAAGTGLSSHELNMPGAYKDVKDTSAVAQFKVVQNEKSQFLYNLVDDGDVYFIAWTTTPWTLPSNTALAVGAKVEYVLVKTFNPYTKLPVNLIMAKDLVSKWLKPEQAELDFDAYQPEDKLAPYQVIGDFKGAEFEMLDYEQLLPYTQPTDGDAFKVLTGDFVTTEEGTGIVHIAPAFGADDMRIAKKYGFGSLTLVDQQGKFVDEVTDFAGRYVKDYKDEGDQYQDVDIDISIKLKKENKAFNVQKYNHNYPHCWRTDKPVLYYPLDSWFIKSTAMRERMIELNKTINWKPAHTGEKRFGNWLENLQDWNLSRSRYWGTPLPIWTSDDSDEIKCIGSIAELTAEIEKANEDLGLNQEVPKDLHRPYIDEVTLVSSDGKPMKREADLIDVWFDSGSMPYAQWHYPFENKDKFRLNYPADFIAEGVDQTRGWFFTMHAIAVMAFDSISFKNVVSNGLVQDKLGRKMSKRLGNAVEPFETITKFGADATRWYMISNAQPWDNLKFDLDGIEEVRRKFFGTLYNTYSFFSLYANIDGFEYAEADIAIHDRPEIDQWILSKLNSLIKQVKESYIDYEPTNAARLIQSFVDDHLSNWFVRLSRRRFWKGEYTTDKISAYQTLYRCLESTAKMIAPIAPFFSDWLFLNLNQVTSHDPAESVHLSQFPEATQKDINVDLERKMNYAQLISSMVLSIRKKEKIRVRQPLQRVMLPILDDTFEADVEAVKDLVLSEVNVKEIEYIKDAEGVIKKKAKPNFKTLGRRLGKDMKAGAMSIQNWSQEEISQFEKSDSIDLSINGNTYALTSEDIEIVSEDIPGWQVVTEGGITVALDLTLTESLKAEGTARELVNRIQNLRKSKDFNITDHIHVQLQTAGGIEEAIDKFGAYIKQETLAKSISLSEAEVGEPVEWMHGETVGIELQVAD
jgi:isoleucyl-tRNA synthetase